MNGKCYHITLQIFSLVRYGEYKDALVKVNELLEVLTNKVKEKEHDTKNSDDVTKTNK